MKVIYRNAITGEIVTAKYAKENPETTVKERMKKVPRKAIALVKNTRNGVEGRKCLCLILKKLAWPSTKYWNTSRNEQRTISPYFA